MAAPPLKKARPLSFSMKTETSHESVEKHAHSQPPRLSSMEPSCSTNPSPNKRIRGVIMRKSIVYGNVTHRMTRNEVAIMKALAADTSHNDVHLGHSRRSRNNHNNASTLDGSESWYRWTVYVRGPQNEDLSYFIDKVVFILHETFPDPIRVIEQSPFEVTECGWGQFEVKIEIYFKNNIGMQWSGNVRGRKRTFRQMMDDQGTEGEDVWALSKAELCQRAQHKQNGIVRMFKGDGSGLPDAADTDSNSSSSTSPSSVGFENKLVFLHSLRLYEKPGSDENHDIKGIVEEKYAVIEFYEPRYTLYSNLWMGPHRIVKEHPFNDYWKNRMIVLAEKEQEFVERLSKCHQALLHEIEIVNREWKRLHNEESKSC